MKLIVGLGNIGRQFKDTPHNVGFEFINELRRILILKGYSADAWKNENSFFSEICKIRKDGQTAFLLVKPTTFMNVSGKAVSKLAEKYEFEEVVIVHDDLDIKLGEYKIQRGKGPKGHNGVLSVENIKGSENYLRVRIGVENRVDNSAIPGDIYVIKRMSKAELETVNEVISASVSELITLV
jgi:PTH1 family peptidyl-tRNA hydrolase